jgi:tetratricopeptide (TPR) repeat protein
LILAQHLVAASLRNLGRYDEALHALDPTYAWIDQLEQLPEFAAWAGTRRMAHRGDAGYFASLAGRPREGLEQYLRPVVSSAGARSITTNSPEWELEVLANTYGQVTAAHLLLEEYDFMTAAAETGVVYQQALVLRFPDNVRHAGCLAGFQSVLGHGLMCQGRSPEALEALQRARQTVEDLVRTDPANEFPRVWRMSVAFSQARAWAVWSREGSASPAKRQDRLARAEFHLAEAERFGGELNSGTQTVFLEPARTDVAKAKASLAEIEPTR